LIEEKPVLGIDLGTSNTCVAFVEGDDVKVVTDERGRRVTPSVITLNNRGEVVVGHFAKAQQITNPYGTLYSAKRLIGQSFDDAHLQKALKYLTYTVEDDGENRSVCHLKNLKIYPHEVATQLLLKVKSLAEAYMQIPLQEAVITVPAHFNDRQRKETLLAAENAGLEVLRLINEPTAAALAYGYGQDIRATVAVYDFGGGTFDISILNIDGNVFEVIATGGDSYLGGDDINRRIVDYVVDNFKKESGIDLMRDKMAMQRVLDAAEKAKIDLSEASETVINLPRIAPNVDFNAHVYQRLTRQQLEEMSTDLIEQTLRICTKTFADARVDIPDIDDVVLVGGQTLMPLVRSRVTTFFGREPNDELNPDEVVAIGAAIQAFTLLNESSEVLLIDVTPLTLGIESLGDLFAPVIMRNTKIPHRVSKIFTTSTDYQEQVRIKVYQGEDRIASENTPLGEFVLTNIREAQRREPRIEVTFRIDANGILSVSAMDLDTNESQSIVIEDYAKQATEEHEQRLEDGLPIVGFGEGDFGEEEGDEADDGPKRLEFDFDD
jgi:molecular chaperone DnaK